MSAKAMATRSDINKVNDLDIFELLEYISFFCTSSYEKGVAMENKYKTIQLIATLTYSLLAIAMLILGIALGILT